MMKPSKSKSDVTALMADLAIFHVAVLSRVVTIFLSIISNIIVPDHDAEGVSYFAPEIYLNPSTLRHRILQTFTRWDAAHFLNIASEGYTQDYQWAFFPGYPWLLSIFKSYVPWPYGVSHEEALVISAIWVSNAAFVLAAVGLHRLGRAVLGGAGGRGDGGGGGDGGARRAALLFCASPAGVFLSSGYCGSLYAALSFWGLYLYFIEHRWAGAALLGAAGAVRSNGLLAALPLGAEGLRRLAGLLLLPGPRRRRRRCPPHDAGDRNKDEDGDGDDGNKQAYWLDFLWIVFSTTCHLVIVIAPYIFWQWKGYQAFCVAGEPEIQPSWCHNKIPSLYGYVQDKYWNVGFLKYWQLKQIPNFALALPALLLWSRDASAYFRELFAAAETCWIKVQDQGSKHKELLSLHFIRSFAITFCESDELTLENNYRPGPSSQKSPPPKMRLFGLYIQWSILAFMSIFVINVQVATRLFSSSCPCFYWALGHYYITSESYQENNRIDWKNNVFRYLLFYNLLGVILHPNFLPWT